MAGGARAYFLRPNFSTAVITVICSYVALLQLAVGDALLTIAKHAAPPSRAIDAELEGSYVAKLW